MTPTATDPRLRSARLSRARRRLAAARRPIAAAILDEIRAALRTEIGARELDWDEEIASTEDPERLDQLLQHLLDTLPDRSRSDSLDLV